MNNTIENIKEDIKELFSKDESGHGFDHIMRVYNTAMQIADKEEKANKEIIALAVLLHDADDYKLFGRENAKNFANTNMLLDKYNYSPEVKEKVLNIVQNMGYSKSMQGIRPKSLEGKIVSDADMIDAMGAMGVTRCLMSKLTVKKNAIFNKDIFPELNMSAEEYKRDGRESDTFINHFFEKTLKLPSLMFTEEGKKEAQIRQEFLTSFLYHYFREQGLNNWIQYLNTYLNDYKQAS